jgi:hypothetical protein
MTRLFAALVALSLAAAGGAQDAPKPPAPKADEKKAEPKKAEPRDEKPADGDEVDVQKTVERIAENAQKAGDRLKDKDPGEDTRKIQQEIIKDIDALLKKAQQPPPMPPDMPPPMSDMMPPPKSDMPPPKSDMPPPKNGSGMPPPKSGMPMGGGAGSPQSKAGNSGGGGSSNGRADRRPRKERRPRGDSPMGMGDPMANAGQGGMQPMPATPQPKDGPKDKDEKPGGDGSGVKFGPLSPKRQNDKLADLYKDVWGNLPDRMRQEMDLYYREQFMPRYSELLRQYYAALAEQRKKGTEDR